jgi:hypothetical protein
MITRSRKASRSAFRALLGFAWVTVLGLLLFATQARAQNWRIDGGLNFGTNSGSGTDGLTNPCNSYPNNSCIVVVSYNENGQSGSGYWYNTTSGSNGLGGAGIYFAINNVYQTEYTANGSSDPGAIAVVGPTDGTQYTFLGAQVYPNSNCSNQAYSWKGWDLTSKWGSTTGNGALYTLGIPYAGSGC